MDLTLPLSESAVRSLSAGDAVFLSGLIYTGRDRFHKFVAEGGDAGVDLRGGTLFHCGPVVVRDAEGQWQVVAAGPTTSIREEPYMAEIIRRTGLRAIIGKGGMGEATAKVCRDEGCVYLQAVGGAAALLAQCVRKVTGVRFLEEFGATEACWGLQVERLPAIVAMDARGVSLYDSVRSDSRSRLDALLGQGCR